MQPYFQNIRQHHIEAQYIRQYPSFLQMCIQQKAVAAGHEYL